LRRRFGVTRRLGEVLGMAMVLGGCAAQGPKECTLGLVTELPIRIAGGHLYTTVKRNGIDLRMIIDTGSEWTTVSKAAATRMGLSFRRAGGLYGVEDTPRYMPSPPRPGAKPT
jgi:hypothetical protein